MTIKALITVLALSILGITTTPEVSLEETILQNSKIVMETDGDDLAEVISNQFSLDGIYRISIRKFDNEYFYLAEGYTGENDEIQVQLIDDIHAVINQPDKPKPPCNCGSANNQRWMFVYDQWQCYTCCWDPPGNDPVTF